MKLLTRNKITIAVLVALAVFLGVRQYRSHMLCLARKDSLRKLVEGLTDDARGQLRPGTNKAGVVRFFQDHHMQVDFGYGIASGSFVTSGCAPFGCGADTAIVGVSVKVNGDGMVVSEPQVSGMFNDCM